MDLLESFQRRPKPAKGPTILIPRILNPDDYEAFPQDDTVHRIIGEQMDEEAGKLEYTTKFADGHVERVGRSIEIPFPQSEGEIFQRTRPTGLAMISFSTPPFSV